MQQIQVINPPPNIHTLASEERKKLMRRKFEKTSRFQHVFKTDAVDLDCGQYSQELRDEIIRLLSAKGIIVPDGDLENLHKTLPQGLKDYTFFDGTNQMTKYLYDTDDRFLNIYHAMIKNSIQKHFPFPFYFQATTTIRIHCPDARNSDHYPRYHTDVNYGHPPEEINIWIPLTSPVKPQYHGFRLTDVNHTRNIFEEFDYGFEPFIERAIHDKEFNHKINEYAPQVTTPFGKLRAFDSRCIHTGEPLEKHTRASIDIRIIPVEDLQNLDIEYQGTGRRKMLYVPGEAYYKLASDKLQ